MITLKAIPTIYNGIQFKSRMESQFAQWLDDYEIVWDYETARFGKERYCPDFITRWKGGTASQWIEIKPLCFADESLIAVRAAIDTKNSLVIVFQKDREWFAYGLVLNGRLAFFSQYQESLPALAITRDGLIWAFPGSRKM
jgi:hypothetical protein